MTCDKNPRQGGKPTELLRIALGAVLSVALLANLVPVGEVRAASVDAGESELGTGLERGSESGIERESGPEPESESGPEPDSLVAYLDEAGEAQARGDATLLGTQAAWGEDGAETWYVAEGDVLLDARVEVRGDVRLILADGAQLTACEGVRVPRGSTLAVYAQEGGTGALDATGLDGNAAIGTDCRDETVPGVMAIHGGVVRAVAKGVVGEDTDAADAACCGAAIGRGYGAAEDVGDDEGVAPADEGDGGADRGAAADEDATKDDGVGGESSGDDGEVSYDRVIISGGKVTAESEGGPGIAAGSVVLTWTEATFDASKTTVRASSYMGDVTFLRPYAVVETGEIATAESAAGADIVPAEEEREEAEPVAGDEPEREPEPEPEPTVPGDGDEGEGKGEGEDEDAPAEDSERPAKDMDASEEEPADEPADDPADDPERQGVRTVPEARFDQSVPLVEGRWYSVEAFVGAATEGDATSVSMPVDSAFTARVDAARMARVADRAGVAGGMISDLAMTFGRDVPAGTVVTLMVYGEGDAGDGSGRGTCYWTELGRAADTVRLGALESVVSPGELFEPDASDKDYLVIVDFAKARAAATSEPVGVSLSASYVDAAGKGRDARVWDGGEFVLVSLGELEATPGSNWVGVVAAPGGSALLAGKRVYLVGKVALPSGAEGVNLQRTAATYGEGDGAIAGEWVSDDTVAFDLGAYDGEGADAVALGEREYRFEGDALAAGDYAVSWALYVGDALGGGVVREASHVLGARVGSGFARSLAAEVGLVAADEGEREGVALGGRVSNTVTSVFASASELPRLAVTGPAHRRVYGGGETLTFAVTSNRDYAVRVERQTALRTFAAMGAGESHEKDVASVEVVVPDAVGTYRVVFSLDGFEATSSGNDDMCYTVVVW